MAKSVAGWRLPVLVALACATALLSMQVIQSDAGAQTAQSAAVKRVKITMTCSLTRGSANSPCRGSWKMSGGFKDSGKVRESSARDSGRGMEGIRGKLVGKAGSMFISTSPVSVSTLLRNCKFVSTMDVRNSGTKRYAGWRGSSVKGGCTKVSSSSRTTKITMVQSVRLEKR